MLYTYPHPPTHTISSISMSKPSVMMRPWRGKEHAKGRRDRWHGWHDVTRRGDAWRESTCGEGAVWWGVTHGKAQRMARSGVWQCTTRDEGWRVAKGGTWQRAARGEGQRVVRCDIWQRGEREDEVVSERKEKKKKKNKLACASRLWEEEGRGRHTLKMGTTRPRICQREGVPNTCREKRKGQQEGRKEREEKKKTWTKNLPNLRQGGGCVWERGKGEDMSQSVVQKGWGVAEDGWGLGEGWGWWGKGAGRTTRLGEFPVSFHTSQVNRGNLPKHCHICHITQYSHCTHRPRAHSPPTSAR